MQTTLSSQSLEQNEKSFLKAIHDAEIKAQLELMSRAAISKNQQIVLEQKQTTTKKHTKQFDNFEAFYNVPNETNFNIPTVAPENVHLLKKTSLFATNDNDSSSILPQQKTMCSKNDFLGQKRSKKKSKGNAKKTSNNVTKQNNSLLDFSKIMRNASKILHDISKTSRNTSETSHDTSETSRDTSETLRDIYETSHDTSESLRDISKTLCDTSETLRDIYETSHDTSETLRDTSKTSRDTSETLHDTSEKLCVVSEPLHDTSETLCSVSETLCDTSKKLCNVSETSRDTSETLCSVSETSRNTSETLCNVSETLRDTSETLQSPIKLPCDITASTICNKLSHADISKNIGYVCVFLLVWRHIMLSKNMHDFFNYERMCCQPYVNILQTLISKVKYVGHEAKYCEFVFRELKTELKFVAKSLMHHFETQLRPISINVKRFRDSDKCSNETLILPLIWYNKSQIDRILFPNTIQLIKSMPTSSFARIIILQPQQTYDCQLEILYGRCECVVPFLDGIICNKKKLERHKCTMLASNEPNVLKNESTKTIFVFCVSVVPLTDNALNPMLVSIHSKLDALCSVFQIA